MSKIFYDHLIVIDDVLIELERHKLTAFERQEILGIIDQHVHHHVLNAILTHLPKEKHGQFLNIFHAAPYHKDLLDYLKKEVSEDIETKISGAVEKAKKEIIAEIRKKK